MFRDEIAGCSEKAQDSLSLANAKKILMLLRSDQELQAYVLNVSVSARACVKFYILYRISLQFLQSEFLLLFLSNI